jgi:CheY-like chemotaxis protein
MALHILIADDDVEDLEILEESLQELQPGLHIDKALSGDAAIKRLSSYSDTNLPNLIVLDYNMPNVGGIDVLVYLKERKRYDSVPRVIFSTSAAERYISESLKNGATKYFVKPQTKRELNELTLQMLSLATVG